MNLEKHVKLNNLLHRLEEYRDATDRSTHLPSIILEGAEIFRLNQKQLSQTLAIPRTTFTRWVREDAFPPNYKAYIKRWFVLKALLEIRAVKSRIAACSLN